MHASSAIAAFPGSPHTTVARTSENGCDWVGELRSLDDHHSNSENGCDWVGELRSLDDHLTTCGYTFICCPNRCVGKKKKKWLENKKEVGILRRDLDQHLKDKCPNRKYQCPHCKDTGRYCYITTTHLKTCPKLEVPCPNSECTLSQCLAVIFRSPVQMLV